MKVTPGIIVRAGLTLLNEIGLEQLTLRRLATDLNIQAPTLYWHFKSKDQLIDAMATLILAEGVPMLLPRKKSPGWRPCIDTFGHGLRQTLLKYRDAARVVAGSRLTDTTYIEATEQIGTHLIDAGFSTRNAVILLSTVYTFTVSFVVEEQAVFPTPGQRSPAYNLADRSVRLDPKKFPLMRQVGPILFDRFDRRYKESLNLILNGVLPSRLPLLKPPPKPSS